MSYVVKSRGHASHQRDGYDAWWDEIQLRIEFINKEVVTLQRHGPDGRRNGSRTPTPVHMDAPPRAVDGGDGIPTDRGVEAARNVTADVTAEIQNLCEHLRSGTPIDPELLEEIDCLSDAGSSDLEEACVPDTRNGSGRLDKRRSPETDVTGAKPEGRLKRRAQSAPVQRGRTAGLGEVPTPEEISVQREIAATQEVVTRRSQATCIPMSARSYQVPSQTTVITDWATPPIGYGNRRLIKYR